MRHVLDPPSVAVMETPFTVNGPVVSNATPASADAATVGMLASATPIAFRPSAVVKLNTASSAKTLPQNNNIRLTNKKRNFFIIILWF